MDFQNVSDDEIQELIEQVSEILAEHRNEIALYGEGASWSGLPAYATKFIHAASDELMRRCPPQSPFVSLPATDSEPF